MPPAKKLKKEHSPRGRVQGRGSNMATPTPQPSSLQPHAQVLIQENNLCSPGLVADVPVTGPRRKKPRKGSLDAPPCLHYVPRTAREAAICDGLRVLQRLFVEGYDPPGEQIEALLKDTSAVEGALAFLLSGVLGLGFAAAALRRAGAKYGCWSKDKGDKNKRKGKHENSTDEEDRGNYRGNYRGKYRTDCEDEWKLTYEYGNRKYNEKYKDENEVDNEEEDMELETFYKGIDSASEDKRKYNTLIHWAVACDRADILQMVLGEKHRLLNTKNSLGCTALHLSVQYHNIECLRLLVDAGANVNITNALGYTPLHASVKKGDVEALQLMLNNAKVDFTKRDKAGNTILYTAVHENRVECVRALLNVKSFANISDMIDSSLLNRAAEHGHSKILEMLLKIENVDVNKRDSSGRTPLLSAVCGRRKKNVYLLLEAKANVKVGDYSGTTVFHMAAANGSSEVLETLLNIQTDVIDKQDNTQITALHYAVDSNKIQCLLLEAKANVNISNDMSKRDILQEPLCMALRNQNIKSVHLLMEHGAKLNGGGWNGMYPIHYAAQYGFTEALKLILESEIEVDIKDKSGQTPLFLSVTWESNFNCIRLLIDAGADVYIEHKKETLLHKAIYFYKLECLQIILDAARNADVKGNLTRFRLLLEVQNSDGYTALHLASARCQTQSLELLLKAGSDVTSRTPDGTTALELCGSQYSFPKGNLKRICINLLLKANRLHQLLE